MIKHNSYASVISPFHPMIALNSQIREKVNQELINPKLTQFFKNKGGIGEYEQLDIDKITTDIEFSLTDSPESYVNSYVYQELVQKIAKNEQGRILFKPRYVICFDEDLTPYKDKDDGTQYGQLKLGNKTILYFIYISLQEVIRFVKACKKQL